MITEGRGAESFEESETMTDSPDYVPPKVWTWTKPSGGTFANINRPVVRPDPREGAAGRPSSAAALFAGNAERRESHRDAGGTAGARATQAPNTTPG